MTSQPPSGDIMGLLAEGAALHRAGRLDDAGARYARVLELRPGNADALHLAGVIALQRGDAARAAELIGRAVAANPGFADAQANLGNALRALGRPEAAVQAYDRAMALQPAHFSALAHRAATRRDLGDFAGAAKDAEAALAFDRDGVLPPGQPAADRARICDWTRRKADIAAVRSSIEAGRMPPSALVVLALIDDPALQRRMGALLAPPSLPSPLFPAGETGAIIRLGVFSGECGDTAVWRLAVEAIERIDPARFELVCFGWGPPREGPMRSRIEASFARFHEVGGLDDGAVAALARSEGIDIALDMAGYTRWARPGIFAARAAPVQVNWLAYPASMGAPWTDYIVADEAVVPRGSDEFFTEAVVRLPGCFQPNDRQRTMADAPMSRAEAGLPHDGFVFACFNQPYKISPELFGIWMELLGALPGSVLWLIDALPQASANLRSAARAAGIAADRLVFAPPLPLDQHLARHRLADLALDTAGYNGHTTTSDALWAGLPVVTLAGRSFAARVAASLLEGCGLGELVAETPDSYASTALGLARSARRLDAAKAKLADSRQSAAPFDTPGHVRALQDALAEMHRRRCAGLPPQGI